MATAPITVQGSSTGKNPNFSTYAQHKPVEVVTPVPPGPKTFKFPLDDVSAGNFWTKLAVNSWVPVRPAEELVDKQGHKLNREHIANIWLPMPGQLSTAYNQTYTETDDMMVNRGTGIDDVSTLKGFASTFWNQAKAVGAQGLQEGATFVSSIANINNSGKMTMGSVMNQMMGLVYDGASLRKHSLSWRMTPKNKEEQAAISQVVFALKSYSAPIIMGPLGGEVNHATSVKALEEKTKEVADADRLAAGGAAMGDGLGFLNDQVEAIQDSMRNIGRLGIPATINAEFWFGNAINPNLFQIKDSFITSVAINYTPSAQGWNAYRDGAPIETELSISLKENAILSQKDIHASGGY